MIADIAAEPEDGSRQLRAYVVQTVAVALGSMVICWMAFGRPPLEGRWPELVVLVAVLCFCEVKPIRVVRAGGVDEVVASTTFAFAVFLSFGPVAAMLAQAVASLIADVVARKAPIKAVFNVAQYWCCWGAAAFVLDAVHGAAYTSAGDLLTARWSVAVALAASVYFLVNNVLVAVAVSLHERSSMRESVLSTIRTEWSSDFVLLALTPVVVIVTNASLLALPLLLLPILAVYRSATLSAEKEHLALHDSLTDLPNRVKFSSVVTRRLAQPPGRTNAAVLLIDLDRFKEVNDTLGHQAGDELLCMIGPRIMEVLPPTVTVARLGGDEFAVLLPSLSDDAEAFVIARHIAQELESPFRLQGFNIEVEASIGVAISPADGTSDAALIKHADIAMYVAKTRRTVVERYDEQLDHHSTRRLEMIGELRTAIAESQIVLHYQPKLDLDSGAVDEVEALVRWAHPTLGFIQPAEFVPLAEHTGLIRPLTSYVLREAITRAARWQQMGRHLSVAVNLSARSLHDGAIADEVAALLQESKLSPRRLRLEITESSIMADPYRARKVLDQLSDLGVRLSIDDFGTGYSSLAYLQELPVSEIKIDRSFVTHVLDRPGDQVIVRSTIDLARNLGLTAVAEGVESEAALRWLADQGCHQAQGYHIAHPMTADSLMEWLVDWERRALAPVARPLWAYLAPVAGAQVSSAC